MKEREENPIRNIRGQRKGSSIFGSTSSEALALAFRGSDWVFMGLRSDRSKAVSAFLIVG